MRYFYFRLTNIWFILTFSICVTCLPHKTFSIKNDVHHNEMPLQHTTTYWKDFLLIENITLCSINNNIVRLMHVCSDYGAYIQICSSRSFHTNHSKNVRMWYWPTYSCMHVSYWPTYSYIHVSYIPNFVSTCWEFRAIYSTIIDVGMLTCSSYKKLSQLIHHSYNLSNK